MNATPNTDPIAKLETLAAGRTTRTDRLDAAVKGLLSRLERICQVGDSATVNGYGLTLVELRSNVGTEKFWLFYDGEANCHLDCSFDSRRYLHGDFNVEVTGPTRAQLIVFGRWCRQFVDALISGCERDNEALDEALATVAAQEVPTPNT